MPKKRKPPVPAEGFAVEMILWEDAQVVTRASRSDLDEDPCINATVGFVLHDDEKFVTLVHEVADIDPGTADDTLYDATKIPKSLIKNRVALGRASPLIVFQEEVKPNA